MSAVVVVTPESDEQPQQPSDSAAAPVETLIELAKEQGQQTANQAQQSEQIEQQTNQLATIEADLQSLRSRVENLETAAGTLRSEIQALVESWEQSDETDQDETEIEVVEPAAESNQPGPGAPSLFRRVIFGPPRH